MSQAKIEQDVPTGEKPKDRLELSDAERQAVMARRVLDLVEQNSSHSQERLDLISITKTVEVLFELSNRSNIARGWKNGDGVSEITIEDVHGEGFHDYGKIEESILRRPGKGWEFERVAGPTRTSGETVIESVSFGYDRDVNDDNRTSPHNATVHAFEMGWRTDGRTNTEYTRKRRYSMSSAQDRAAQAASVHNLAGRLASIQQSWENGEDADEKLLRQRVLVFAEE